MYYKIPATCQIAYFIDCVVDKGEILWRKEKPIICDVTILKMFSLVF